MRSQRVCMTGMVNLGSVTCDESDVQSVTCDILVVVGTRGGDEQVFAGDDVAPQIALSVAIKIDGVFTVAAGHELRAAQRAVVQPDDVKQQRMQRHNYKSGGACVAMKCQNTREVGAVKMSKDRLLADGVHEQRQQQVAAVAYDACSHMQLPVPYWKQRGSVGYALARTSAVDNLGRGDTVKGCNRGGGDGVKTKLTSEEKGWDCLNWPAAMVFRSRIGGLT